MLALLFLLVTIAGLLAALVALKAPRQPQPLVAATFFPSLLFSEWAPQILVLHLAVIGALTPWAWSHTLSRVGLAVATVTTLALVWLTLRQVQAWRARPGLDGPRPTWLQRWTALPIRPRDVEVARNLTFAEHDGRPLRLDVLRRRAPTPTNAPVLLQVHGGAWVFGRKEDQALPLLHLMARRGWVCVSIDYRLSPKATFPDHIVDVKEAIAWVKANIAQYGGDPSKLAITGGSAGGHLAALASLTPGLDQPGFEDADTTVVGCASMYGVYDFTDRKGHWKGRRLDELLAIRVMKVAMADARDRYEAASPMSVATDAAPPFLLVQGTGDTIVPPVEAAAFAEVLRGISREPVTLLEVPRAQHAFDLFASLRTRAVIQHVVRFCEEVVGRSRTGSAGAAERLAVVAGGDAEAPSDVQPEVGG